MLRSGLLTLLLAMLLGLPVRAQFDNMVSNDDGSLLLFQSQWRLAGGNDGNLTKIYRWDPSGFSLVYSPVNTGLFQPPAAFAPFTSGDGTISGYLKYPGCSSTCGTAGSTPVVTGATLPSTLPASGYFQISRNGRYVVAGSTVLDRNTGALQTITTTGDAAGTPAVTLGGRFSIGNNGDILYLVLHQVFILSTVDLVLSGHPAVTIANAPAFYTALVAPAENRVIYEVAGPSTQTDRQLWSYDVAAGRATMLEEQDFGTTIGVSQFQPTISNDGARLLYRRRNPTTLAWEAVVRDYASGTATVVANMLPSANNFTITGDGKSAWVHRADGRLVRVAIASLAATPATGRHAWVAQREGGAVYGSYHHLWGGGFVTGDAGLPTDLSVDISGLPAPILNASTQELDIEIPWQAYPGSYSLTLRDTSSPFESLLPIDIVDLAPTFERTGTPSDTFRSGIVVHQDFRSLASFSNPVLAGETVHFYLTGLGSVQPQPGTGQVATTLPVANQRPVCWLTSFSAPTQLGIPVLFAGIAPGMIGIYQMDVTIPPSYPTSLVTLSCVDEASSGLAGDYIFFNVKAQ